MSAAESSVTASRVLDDLYRHHAAEVYRYAYAVLGNHADAEDVTQTTFINALRALERGERPRKASNWLITITHNIVRQRYRHQSARPTEVELDRDVPQQPADESGPSMEELVRALQRIPQSQREALVMRELEGRPYNEIAQILELSNGALETLLFRARRSLADELENQVTCDRAELGLSKQLDQRLSRKERKRLDDHIAECPSCAHLQRSQGKHRRAFKGLALLPLPLSLTLFKGTPSAAAAVGLPTIGAVGAASAVGGGAAVTTGAGSIGFGGLAFGGVALKAAAVIAAVSVTGGVSYVGAKEVQSHRSPAKTPVTASSPAKPRPAAAGGAARSASTQSKGKALAKGSARATSPTGRVRGVTARGRIQRAAARLHQPARTQARAKLNGAVATKGHSTATHRSAPKSSGQPSVRSSAPASPAKAKTPTTPTKVPATKEPKAPTNGSARTKSGAATAPESTAPAPSETASGNQAPAAPGNGNTKKPA